MKNIKALAKYEINNFKRGKLIWVLAILYIFGIEQAISSMYIAGTLNLSIVGLIKISWLPLNLIMIPILLIGMKFGQSDDEIFQCMNISPREKILSKLMSILIIDGVIFIINTGVFIIVGILSKVNISYVLYQGKGYILNTIIFLLVSSSIGLLIGKVISKYIGDVISFIVIIISFIILSNFYKTFNVIVPLIDINTFPSSFEALSYNKSYFYHNILWLIVTVICIEFMLIHEHLKQNYKVKFRIGSVIILAVSCIYLGSSIIIETPNVYDIRSKRDIEDKNEIINTDTFLNFDTGFYVYKYNMNINIEDELKNNCEMYIKITKDNVNSIQFGLYKNLNISSIEVDNKVLKFDRNNNSFKINLPKEYYNGDEIKIKVSYSGRINTSWFQGKKLFFAEDSGMFLADVFEWYPKLNDSVIKEYNLEIKYNSKNEIYSNLDESKVEGKYNLQGKDREIFIISGRMAKREYKNHLFIGNEEIINEDKQCNNILEYIQKGDIGDRKKIVFGPFIPGLQKIEKHYEKAYLDTFN